MTEKIKSGDKLTRVFTINRRSIDEEARTVELSFSSEEPYQRWWGVEVLSHEPGAMRTERLMSGSAPLLLEHDPRDQIGVIEKLTSVEGKGRAMVRFSRSKHADEVFQDVIDGIRKNVSVGYLVHKVEVDIDNDEGTETTRVTDWEPFEISIVSVPADNTVGVGRSLTKENQMKTGKASKREDEEVIKDDEDEKSEEVIEETDEETVVEGTEDETTEEEEKSMKIVSAKKEGQAAERKRVVDLTKAGEAYRDFGGVELAKRCIAEGYSLAAFQRTMQERVASGKSAATRTAGGAPIGLTNAEARRFSFVRALNALANPHDQRAQEAAAFEIECSHATAKALGKTAQGILVPNEVLKRELTAADQPSAGVLVDEILMSQDFISMLRNAMILPSLGVRMMTGLVGDIAIPRQTGGATGYWVEESNDVTDSDPTFDQIKMRPRTVGGFTEISRKLLLQASLDIEAFVRLEIATTIAMEIERAAIIGSGTGEEPTGLINMTGVGLVEGGINGAAPTWANIVALETNVAVANALIENMAYITNAKVRGKLKSTIKEASVPGYVWSDSDTTPLNGYRAAVTNMIPANLVKGTADDCSAIIFGNWADLIIGMWGGLDLKVDPYTKATSGTIRVIGLQDVDVAARHTESFAVMKDALTD